jgi:AraC family transcriptional activator of mtrCDE
VPVDRLLDNLALDIDAFAACRVASGWRVRVPPLESFIFHFVAEGSGEARGSASRGRALAPGSLLLVPPRLAHTIQCGPPPHAEHRMSGAEDPHPGLSECFAGLDQKEGMLLIHGRARVLYGGEVGGFEPIREILVLDFANEPTMGALFQTLVGEVRSAGPGTRAMVSALMDEFLVRVVRRLSLDTRGPMQWLDALDAPDLRPAMSAMLRKPGAPHTVASLAGSCHMSRSTFSRRFSESFGNPPMMYLRGIRIRHAALLLRRNPRTPVARLARHVGFESRSQFTRAFKERFDVPPSEYGRRYSGRPAGSEA